MMDRQLRKIATAARREMENFGQQHADYYFDDLSCLCAISSYFLVMLGKRFGYNLTLVEGVAFDRVYDVDDDDDEESINHCWVEYDGIIIDLTATQFSEDVKKVHVVFDSDINYYSINRNNIARTHLKRFWPDEQKPYTYMPELRKRVAKLQARLS